MIKLEREELQWLLSANQSGVIKRDNWRAIDERIQG